MSLPKQDRLVNPLAKARGLGSSQEGVHHWLQERITAALLIPLVFWLVWSIISLIGVDYGRFVAWMQNPINAVLMLTFVVTAFFHGAMGLQVVIEDYISNHSLRLLKIILVKIAFAIMAVACIFSILRLAL